MHMANNKVIGNFSFKSKMFNEQIGMSEKSIFSVENTVPVLFADFLSGTQDIHSPE